MEKSEEELVDLIKTLLRSRTSGRTEQLLDVNYSHVDDLNSNVLPYVPSAGNFRTFLFGIENQQLALICVNARAVRYKYGVFYSDLLHQESGVIFATANIYLMAKGIGMSYRSNPGAVRYPNGIYWRAQLFLTKGFSEEQET